MLAKIKNKALAVFGVTGVGIASSVPAFATGGSSSAVVVTSEMLQPVVSAITDNLGVLLPVGLTILAVMIGVSLIPRIIYKFF
jgi:hypothetical protein